MQACLAFVCNVLRATQISDKSMTLPPKSYSLRSDNVPRGQLQMITGIVMMSLHSAIFAKAR